MTVSQERISGMEGSIVDRVSSVIHAVRELSAAQSDTWKMIPEAAYNANGRAGFFHSYRLAYTFGVWKVKFAGSEGLYVDLRDGNLMDFQMRHAFGDQGYRTPKEWSFEDSSDESILSLASHLHTIRADTILHELQCEAQQNLTDYRWPYVPEFLRWKEIENYAYEASGKPMPQPPIERDDPLHWEIWIEAMENTSESDVRTIKSLDKRDVYDNEPSGNMLRYFRVGIEGFDDYGLRIGK
jgi:hypothetical protein